MLVSSMRCAPSAACTFGFAILITTLSQTVQGQFPAEDFDKIDPSRAIALPGTDKLGPEKLTTDRIDIASELVAGVDRFLLKQLDDSIAKRQSNWPKPVGSNASYEDAIQEYRKEYATRIGLVDARRSNQDWIVESPLRINGGNAPGDHPSNTLATESGLRIVQVRWNVLEGWDAWGLLVIPQQIRFGAVLIPDAGQFPESLCGRGEASNTDAIVLARAGGLVLIPQVASRHREARSGRAIMTDQEYLYRTAFILGRHLLGYHVHQNVAAIDLLKKSIGDKPILVAGWGEGGWIALATGAYDPRVTTTLVSGHFGPRERVWDEPIHRNIHGLLNRFGDAQLAAMIAPRNIVIDAVPGLSPAELERIIGLPLTL